MPRHSSTNVVDADLGAPAAPAIALALGCEEHVPLLATAQAAELMDALVGQGAGDQDHAAMATLYEQLAGVTARVQT